MTDDGSEEPLPADDDTEDTDGARYELTRRDALAALAAGGVAVAGLGATVWEDRSGAPDGLDDADRDTIVALAEAIYPSAVTGVGEFVETYVLGRVADRPEYERGMAAAVGALDEYARTWNETTFRAASPAKRDELLREMGVDVVDPDPEGSEQERVRYYLVNDLQYALYTSPTGGRLVGLENPQGHPGGIRSYRRPPPSERDG